MLLRGKRVVLTFHDQQTGGAKWQDASWLERLMSRCLFRHPRVWWVAVSQEVKRQLIQKGVPEYRISVIPAYIPPLGGSAQDLPTYIHDFLRVHSPVVSTYAWKLTLDAKGVDVYGFDLCLEAIRSLKEEFPGIGLVISLPQIANPAYYRDLNERIVAYGIQSQVLFVTEPLDEIYLLWQDSDVFVRATNTDGDALTVREALSAGVPVVASNASLRPEGVVLFESRNAGALRAAVQQVLENHPYYVQSLQGKEIEDNFPALLELYRSISKPNSQLSSVRSI
jgi:glycosyltransferase involved in cell wall biosynthesis